jgi:ADP-ribosylation factor-like protein 13B
MFSLCRNAWRYFRRRKEKSITIVLLGIDNAGKTTMLAALQGRTPPQMFFPM